MMRRYGILGVGAGGVSGSVRVFELQGRARRGTHLGSGMDVGHELGVLVLSVR
jgi:hypothetical protein